MRSFDLNVVEHGGATTLQLRGSLILEETHALRDALSRATGAVEQGQRARFDLSAVEHADGAAIVALMQTQAELETRRVKVELSGASAGVEELLRVYSGGAVRLAHSRVLTVTDALVRLGRVVAGVVGELVGWLAFFGATAVAALNAVRRPRQQNWRAIPPLMERAGASATPMVFLINFFVGVVAAYEFGVVTESFQATSFVPNLVGSSITRELGPLMTAIVVAGRTGAPFTEELGTARVANEIDALRGLGIDPIGYLVLPRMAAIVLTLPLLALVADAAGILGGLAVATLTMGMSGPVYLRQMQGAVALHDIVFGLVKSALFGLAIASIACRQGLAATGGASSVERRTAATVVSILFAAVVIDALFASSS